VSLQRDAIYGYMCPHTNIYTVYTCLCDFTKTYNTPYIVCPYKDIQYNYTVYTCLCDFTNIYTVYTCLCVLYKDIQYTVYCMSLQRHTI